MSDTNHLLLLANSIIEARNALAEKIVPHQKRIIALCGDDWSDAYIATSGIDALASLVELTDLMREDAITRGRDRDAHAGKTQALALSVVRMWALLSASGMPDGVISRLRGDFDDAVAILADRYPKHGTPIMYDTELPF